MYSKTQTGRAPKGTVSVEEFQGRLRLRFRIDGKQKTFPMGLPDTPENRQIAAAKAREIERDLKADLIVPGTFDRTLAKYGRQPSQVKLTIVESISRPVLTVPELWEKYFDGKRSGLKAKTIEKYENFSKLFSKLGDLPIDNALAVKKKLETVTTPSRTRDALMYLSSACEWGMKRGQIVSSNPYNGMYQEMPKHRYQLKSGANAFTAEERDRVIEAFKNDKRKGMNYQPYASFVEFLFLTGCRPSEAVGLQWKHVDIERGIITFDSSLVQANGHTRVRSKGSKNNKTRRFPCSSRLQALLESIKTETIKPDELVFKSPTGDSINYKNFSRRAWSAIVDPIKPDTTPYCCRDTFLNIQILKGTPETVLVEWCDTSPEMLRRHYADAEKLLQIRPKD